MHCSSNALFQRAVLPLLLSAATAACEPSPSGGSGGGTTTTDSNTAGAAGSTGTGGTTAMGGSTAGGGTTAMGGGSPLCEQMCPTGTCNGDVCTTQADVDITAGQSHIVDAGGTPGTIRKVLAILQGARSVKYTALATDGPCVLVVSEGVGSSTMDSIPSIGTVTATTASDGKVTLAESVNDGALAHQYFPAGTFAAGESVLVEATGGADMAAFSLSSTAPIPFLSVTAPATASVGQPLTVSWDPPDPVDSVALVGPWGKAICKPGDATGEFAIPVSILGAINFQAGDSAIVLAYRETPTITTEDAGGHRARLRVFTQANVWTTLTP